MEKKPILFLENIDKAFKTSDGDFYALKKINLSLDHNTFKDSEIMSLANICKNLTFTFDKLYNEYLLGDKNAFELLYNKYKNRIQYFIFKSRI